jgi:hypothetical protein
MLDTSRLRATAKRLHPLSFALGAVFAIAATKLETHVAEAAAADRLETLPVAVWLDGDTCSGVRLTYENASKVAVRIPDDCAATINGIFGP